MRLKSARVSLVTAEDDADFSEDKHHRDAVDANLHQRGVGNVSLNGSVTPVTTFEIAIRKTTHQKQGV